MVRTALVGVPSPAPPPLALLTQLAESAAQRKLSDLVIAKAAGSSAAALKAGFSLADLKAAGFLTTNADLKAAIARDMSDIEDWDVSVIEDFGFLFFNDGGGPPFDTKIAKLPTRGRDEAQSAI